MKMKRKLAVAMTMALAGSALFSVPTQAEEKTKLTLWHIQTGTMASCLENSAKRFMKNGTRLSERYSTSAMEKIKRQCKPI